MTSVSVKRLKLDEDEFRSDSIDPERCWNDEMKLFYNHSWGVESGRETSGEPVQWTDFPHALEKRRTCHMCGGSGHEAVTCPNSCCLNVRT